MPVLVSSSLIPKNSAKWPVLDDAYLKGGLRVVANAAARDAIYADANAKLGLKIGMLCVTQDDLKVWQYTAAGVWTLFNTGGSTTSAGPVLYTHVQQTADTTWHVAHAKHSHYFTMSVFVNNELIVPDSCQIQDDDNLVLTFAGACVGHATFFFNVV